MADNTVAATIKKQVGVWPFAEVGARGFMFDPTTLYFDAKPKSRIVRVTVKLTPADLYDVRVINKKTGDTMHAVEGAYAEDLPRIIRTLAEHV